MREKLLAEFLGAALLLVVVVGSGIAGEQLAGGNVAVALLANSIATGAGLYVLISLLGPISGAHFNPVVSLMMWRCGKLNCREWGSYTAAQISGGIVGVWLTHFMYALPILQTSSKTRTGMAQWGSEVIATMILLATINLSIRYAKERVAMCVALVVTGGYWFTASTFFANPAVTIARALTDTFAGIAPVNVAGFIAAQLCGFCVFYLFSRRTVTPH